MVINEIAMDEGAPYVILASLYRPLEKSMSDKKKPIVTTTPQSLSDEETEKVVGGMNGPPIIGKTGGTTHELPPSCVATTDTGMMGCPG